MAKTLEQMRQERAERRYKTLVRFEIRKKYTVEDEIGILRQKESKPEEYEAWTQYVEQCKTNIKKMLGIK